jgi:hypothetical protein
MTLLIIRRRNFQTQLTVFNYVNAYFMNGKRVTVLLFVILVEHNRSMYIRINFVNKFASYK